VAIEKLRTANPGIKVIAVIVVGYLVSALLDMWLPTTVSHGIGFFSVLILSYPTHKSIEKALPGGLYGASCWEFSHLL
jgi:hypothetical protein